MTRAAWRRAIPGPLRPEQEPPRRGGTDIAAPHANEPAAGDSFTPPPIPVHLAGFPTAGGLVVPYTTLRHRGGKVALGLVDGDLADRCLRNRLCGVCGQPLPGRTVFLMRASDLVRKYSVEPGMCPPCAAYTRRACPMVSGFMGQYRKGVNPLATRRCGDELCPCRGWSAPGGKSARFGAPADRWYALWVTQYRLGHDPDGRLAAGFSGLRVLALREIPVRAGLEADR